MKSSTTSIARRRLASCRPSVVAPRAEIIEQILVKVNGEIFTKTDLEKRQVAALRQMGQADRPESDPTTRSCARCSTR